MSGVNETGKVTLLPDEAIPLYARVKRTSTGVALADAGDPTYGSALEQGYIPDTDRDNYQAKISVKVWNACGQHFAIANAAIAAGAEFQGADDGEIAPLTTGPAIGRVGSVAAAGDQAVVAVDYYPPQAGSGSILFGDGMPLSGTSGTGAGDEANNQYYDTTNDVLYVNEGTVASPYWSPASYQQSGLLGTFTDFRDGVGKAVANTDATATIPGSGVRVFGQGIAEDDSGLTVAYAEGGAVASLATTNEAAHTAALSIFGSTLVWQPDVNGAMVIDALVSNSAAITNRALFCGFLGTAADALDPAVTGSGTTLTLVQDDLAGLFFDSGLTDADRLYAPHNKSNEAATIETDATGVDTETDIAAAGTYQRLRVQISEAGAMTCFVNKTQVTSIAASLDADEEVVPVLYIEANTTAVTTLLVKHFAAFTSRAT